MEILFQTKKLQKTFSNERELNKEYGELSRKIKQRLSEILSAECLADLSANKPTRCHELKGHERGIFSVDVSPNYRLLFHPTDIKPPRKESQPIDLNDVDSVIIIGVEDTHEKKRKR